MNKTFRYLRTGRRTGRYAAGEKPLLIGTDPSLFEGLAISRERKLCERHMGKYPVIFVTLKDMEGNDFRTACRMAANKISQEASRYGFLRTSPALTEKQKEQYEKLCSWDMDPDILAGSLGNLCYFLEKHYGQKESFP